MGLLTRIPGNFVLLAALTAPGCGRPTADNSAIQTPADQPIGPPQFQKNTEQATTVGPSMPLVKKRKE